MDDLSEKEQLEALRAWWAENGNYVVGGIIVGIVIIFGWNRWQTSIETTEVAASTLFEDVMEAASRGNVDAAEAATDEIVSDYEDTPYAAQARLALARIYMDNGRDEDAARTLRALVDSDPDSEISLVGRLRLAKVLLYQDRAEEVVNLVDGLPESAFSARFNEVLGDAHVALGNYSAAEAAYIAALNDNPQARTVDVSLIQLKLNDLPAAGEPVDSPAPVEGDAADGPEAPAETEEPENAEEPAEPEVEEPQAADDGESEPEAR